MKSWEVPICLCLSSLSELEKLTLIRWKRSTETSHHFTQIH
jgi:hypothetical protein